MAEVFVLGGGTPTPTGFRPVSPKTVNHQTPPPITVHSSELSSVFRKKKPTAQGIGSSGDSANAVATT